MCLSSQEVHSPLPQLIILHFLGLTRMQLRDISGPVTQLTGHHLLSLPKIRIWSMLSVGGGYFTTDTRHMLYGDDGSETRLSITVLSPRAPGQYHIHYQVMGIQQGK